MFVELVHDGGDKKGSSQTRVRSKQDQRVALRARGCRIRGRNTEDQVLIRSIGVGDAGAEGEMQFWQWRDVVGGTEPFLGFWFLVFLGLFVCFLGVWFVC